MSRIKCSANFCFPSNPSSGTKVTQPPKDIEELFNRYSKNGTMGIDDLRRFMNEHQKEPDATNEDAQEIFNSLKHPCTIQPKGINLDAFFRYLLGDLNPPLPSKVHHDMDAPLAHYFLYTSHKSYLPSPQNRNAVDTIKEALKRGVRVIELDLWPDNEKTSVKVCLEGNLNYSVDLDQCLTAIKESAFEASEYPIVIRFEDHLPPNFQNLVTKLVRTKFGDMVYYPDYGNQLPSPNKLKKKILISTPQEFPKTQDRKEKRSSDQSPGEEVSQIEKSSSKNLSNTNDKDEKHAPLYGFLISIHSMELTDGFGSWPSWKVTCISRSKEELDNVTWTQGKDIVSFTQRNILRIYPNDTRTEYNPYVGWMHGAQMVAFNTETPGWSLWMMQGIFRANGGCGYLKKPNLLLENDPLFDPNKRLRVQKILKVKIYTGEGWDVDVRQSKFPTEFKIALIGGVTADEQNRESKRREKPEWSEEFRLNLTVPELAALLIEGFNDNNRDDNRFAGQACLPVSELKSGIRAVPLYDKNGNPYQSYKLLMRFEFE